MKLSVVKNSLPKPGDVFKVIHAGGVILGPLVRVDQLQGNIVRGFNRDDTDLVYGVYIKDNDNFMEGFFATRKFIVLKPINNGAIFEPA